MDRRDVAFVNRQVTRAVTKLAVAFVARSPRRAAFSLVDMAVGTHTEVVVWDGAPFVGDYAVVVAPTTAAAFVGLVSGSVQAGSKTATGCTVIVANRSQVSIGAATFDVLAFPF